MRPHVYTPAGQGVTENLDYCRTCGHPKPHRSHIDPVSTPDISEPRHQQEEL